MFWSSTGLGGVWVFVWRVFGICLQGVWDLSGRCLASVWKVFGICLEACELNVLSLRAEASESFSPGASGIRFSYFWCSASISGELSGPVWQLCPLAQYDNCAPGPKKCPQYTKNQSGNSFQLTRKAEHLRAWGVSGCLSGGCLGSVCKVFGICLEGVWHLSGRCLGSVWKPVSLMF